MFYHCLRNRIYFCSSIVIHPNDIFILSFSPQCFFWLNSFLIFIFFSSKLTVFISMTSALLSFQFYPSCAMNVRYFMFLSQPTLRKEKMFEYLRHYGENINVHFEVGMHDFYLLRYKYINVKCNFFQSPCSPSEVYIQASFELYAKYVCAQRFSTLFALFVIIRQFSRRASSWPNNVLRISRTPILHFNSPPTIFTSSKITRPIPISHILFSD